MTFMIAFWFQGSGNLAYDVNEKTAVYNVSPYFHYHDQHVAFSKPFARIMQPVRYPVPSHLSYPASLKLPFSEIPIP